MYDIYNSNALIVALVYMISLCTCSSSKFIEIENNNEKRYCIGFDLTIKRNGSIL